MTGTVSPLMDIRDNVQHLRKIHFSLLIACFALLTLTFAREANQYDKALEQLNQIRAALSDWAPGWIDSAAARLVADLDDALGDDLILGAACPNHCVTEKLVVTQFELPAYEHELEEKGLQLLASRPWTPLPLPAPLLELAGAEPDPKSGPLWSKMAKLERMDPQFLNPIPRSYPLAYEPFDIDRPESVGEFQTLWNALDVLTLTFATARGQYWALIGDLRSGGDAFVIRPDDPVDASWPTVELALEPMEDSAQAWWRDRTEHQIRPDYQLIGHTPWGEVNVPVEGKQITLSLRDAFIHSHGLSWTNGTFANNFPNLSAAMQGRPRMSFDETAALLTSESARLETDIVIFGLVIPDAVVSRWGGIIMVIAQFYFWLHLRGFARELKTTTQPTLAPWIGVYDDPLARVTTAVSGFALPPVILAALIFGASTATFMLGLIVVMSLLLGALAFATLRACWVAIDFATKQNP